MPMPKIEEEKMIDTYHTNNIVCPYCGEEDVDGWELFDFDETEVEGCTCGACGKVFNASREFSATYCTYKPLDL